MKRIVNNFLIALIIFGFNAGNMNAQTFNANAVKTVIYWEGKNVVGRTHSGTVSLKSGNLVMKANKLSGGELVVDMTTLKNTDIESDDSKNRLENHLKSDDFFGVEKFPEAVITVKGSERNNGGSLLVKTELIIKGISHPMEFKSDFTEDSGELIFTGHIDIDRTLYNVRFRSTRFFEDLGDKAIKDVFTIDFELHLVNTESLN